MARGDYGEDGVREPDAGFWWIERRDGQRRVVMVRDRDGAKSVHGIGAGDPAALAFFRREYRFLAGVQEPEPVPPSGNPVRPSDGLWWVQRADGRRSVVLVGEHFGRRCVQSVGSASWTTLDAYAKTSSFLAPVPAPEAPEPTPGAAPKLV